MWKWSNLTFHWSAKVTNKAISLVDYSEFRSKFKCIVAYVQNFTELLPGVKSHSNMELTTELFQW